MFQSTSSATFLRHHRRFSSVWINKLPAKFSYFPCLQTAKKVGWYVRGTRCKDCGRRRSVFVLKDNDDGDGCSQSCCCSLKTLIMIGEELVKVVDWHTTHRRDSASASTGLEGLFAFHFYDFPARKLCLLPLHYLNGTTTSLLPILFISLCCWFRTSRSSSRIVLVIIPRSYVNLLWPTSILWSLTLFEYICFPHSKYRAPIVICGWRMDGWTDGFIAQQTGETK